MKILMVGSGAVGQVFGLHLRQAGAELAFYARPESADRLKSALAEGGLPLNQLTWFGRRNPLSHRLTGYRVVTDLASARNIKPDQIWFTTPSPVYHSDWFREFLQVPSKLVVCFAPEGRRGKFVPQGEADRFVFGGITLIAWQGDLEGGGGRSVGVNYWLPPLAAIPLMGEPAACRELAGLLEQAGLRAAPKDERFQATQAATTALLTALVAGLELAGWSFSAFRQSPWFQRAAHAAREAISSQLAEPGIITRALLRIGLTPAMLSLATYILPALTPFDLEEYLKFHYRKTREQTLALLDLFARDGVQRGLPVEDIQGLLDGLRISV